MVTSLDSMYVRVFWLLCLLRWQPPTAALPKCNSLHPARSGILQGTASPQVVVEYMRQATPPSFAVGSGRVMTNVGSTSLSLKRKSKSGQSQEAGFGERIGDTSYDVVTGLASFLATANTKNETQRNLPVQSAIAKMTKDMELLDDVAGRTPQLTRLELVLLMVTVIVSAVSPAALPINVVEVLVPSMAALSAAVGISAEYVGKVAVSNGKEIAALAMQAAAEAESILAQAERAKAILPLCVGISTTASAFALLIPSLAAELQSKLAIPIVAEYFLICPIIAVLGAAIAGLASEETITLSNRAAGVGNRRFASSTTVGVTWRSQTEQVEASSMKVTRKWTSFAYGVVPAPIIAALFPGIISFKAVVCAAVAAAQAAYYLSTAEFAIAQATDAVSLKSRTAAVADTYANQGSRAGSVLPFTSALGGLCAAASAACVEVLPLIPLWELQSLLAVLFPAGAAMFAAAAAVSKARCEVRSLLHFEISQYAREINCAKDNTTHQILLPDCSHKHTLVQVDAAAASAAASTGLSQSAVTRDPKKLVFELILCTLETTKVRLTTFVKKTRSKLKKVFRQFFMKWRSGGGDGGAEFDRSLRKVTVSDAVIYI